MNLAVHRVEIHAEPFHPHPDVTAGRIVGMCRCGRRESFDSAQWIDVLIEAHDRKASS